MNTKTADWVLGLIIVLCAVAGAVVYPQLPDRVASHWNASGQADGYSGKFVGVFLLPIIMAVLYLLYLVVPKIDPLRSNIESFRKYYNLFWIFLFCFLAYIFSLSLAWNLGYRFSFIKLMIPAFVALWYFIGVMLKNTKRNWSVGIRTPWTLSNDIVWEKTHALGGKLFKAAGIVSLLGLFLSGNSVILLILIPAISISVITVVYSYLEFKKQSR